jgi:hypothetical protein
MSWPSELALSKDFVLQELSSILSSDVQLVDSVCFEPVESYIKVIDSYDSVIRQYQSFAFYCNDIILNCAGVSPKIGKSANGTILFSDYVTKKVSDDSGWDDLDLGLLTDDNNNTPSQTEKISDIHPTLKHILEGLDKTFWPSSCLTIPEYSAVVSKLLQSSEFGFPCIFQKIDARELVDDVLTRSTEKDEESDYQNVKDFERDEIEINGEVFKGESK